MALVLPRIASQSRETGRKEARTRASMGPALTLAQIPPGPLSLVRMRTLDKYPMQYSRSELHSRLSAHRANRLKLEIQVHHDAHTSTNLRNYGKQLFNDTISKSGSLNSSSGSDSSLGGAFSSSLPNIAFTSRERKAESPSYAHAGCRDRPTTQHSGPSRQGSVLYNPKPTLLNAIRLRANSEPPPPVPSPSRTQTAEGIATTLRNSNAAYRVVNGGSPGTFSRGSVYSCPPVAYTNFVLVPAHETVPETPEPEPKTPEHKPKTPEHAKPTKTVTIISEASREREELEEKERHAEEEQETQQETQLQPTPAPQLPNDDVTREQDQENSETSSHSAGSVKQQERWNRRSCWVDYATVTSSSKSSHHSLPPAPPPPDPKDTKDTKNTKLQKHGGKKAPVKELPEPKPEPVKEEVKEEEPAPQETIKVLSLHELQDGEAELPKYICPSSEEKSKQARVKDWLQKTGFAWANRNVPLL